MIRIIFIIALAVSSVSVSARENADSIVSIVDRLFRRPNVTVVQPVGLAERLRPAEDVPTLSETTSAGGYRIQVFSDNNARTAEREAHSRAAAISESFPQWGTYITYDSPYWRLRVGDFQTYEDATDAVMELKNAFPAYRRELRVVRDRIRIVNRP